MNINRDIANGLNQILFVRTKDVLDRKPIGITNLIERNHQRKNIKKNFDEDLKEHIVKGYKLRNVRGLFRVPDAGQRLVIDALRSDNEDNDDKEEEEQKNARTFSKRT